MTDEANGQATENEKQELRRLTVYPVVVNLSPCEDPDIAIAVSHIQFPVWPEVVDDAVVPPGSRPQMNVTFRKGVLIRLTRRQNVIVNMTFSQEQAADVLKRIAKAIVIFSPEKVDALSEGFMQGVKEGLSEIPKVEIVPVERESEGEEWQKNGNE